MESESDQPRSRPEPARRSLWSAMPRRDLARAVVLLFALLIIVALRQRAGAIARGFSTALFGSGRPPATRPAVPPRVRLESAPPPARAPAPAP